MKINFWSKEKVPYEQHRQPDQGGGIPTIGATQATAENPGPRTSTYTSGTRSAKTGANSGSDSVRPTYLSYVTAWRCWRLLHNGMYLRSPYVSIDRHWPTRAALEFNCAAIDASTHLTPSLGCSCGIHGFSPSFLVSTMLEMKYSGLSRIVVGTVALWGGVVEHQRGWRAQYGYPLKISCIYTREGFKPVPDDLALKLANTYGVEIGTLDDLARAVYGITDE